MIRAAVHIGALARPLIVLAMVLLSLTPQRTSAQESTPTASPAADLIAYEIYPQGKMLGDFFDEEIEAGETAELTVVLANTGNVDFEGRTYAIDAFTEVNGGLAIADAGTDLSGPSTWLDYPEEIYAIEPGTGIERTFTVAVPEGTASGEYLTAVILENAEARAVEGSDNFSQVVRFAVPILITVPGDEEPGFEIGAVTATSTDVTTTIDVEIANTGNVRVRPAGTVVLSDASGEQLLSAPVAMGSVFARDATVLRLPLPQPLPPGEYEIAIELADDEQSVSASDTTMVAVTAPATPVAALPVQVIAGTATPLPSPDDVQFVTIDATIENTGDPLTGVQVVLRVTRDGEAVEDYSVASSLALPNGSTEIAERYIPAEGWSSGTWGFTLSVEAVDPGTGVSTVLTTFDLPDVEVA